MYKIFYKTELCIGKGALEQLKTYQNQTILVVADPFLESSGQLTAMLAYLDSSNDVITFTEIVPDPPIETVVAGIKSAENRPVSMVLAIGGGSAIDAAKAIYYFAQKQGLFEQAILVAVPTTSGTGSEVTDFSIITDTERETKYPLVSRDILPDVAILDANLVLSLPDHITADTGMDVLTHAIEAYVSTQATDFSDALAEKAIKLVFDYLPRAYRDGQDIEAREKMHTASTLAGMAFNTASLGLNHGLAHAAGARFHIPHGRLNSILMPHVIHYNANFKQGGRQNLAPAAKRYQELARLLGASAANPLMGVRQLVDLIKKLQKSLDLPTSLSQYGILAPDFEQGKEAIARAALVDSCTKTNPRKPQVAEVIKVLEAAF